IFARMGLGGAYLTKPFDEVTNPLNLSYSTNLSFAIMVGFGVNYPGNRKGCHRLHILDFLFLGCVLFLMPDKAEYHSE
ncbi:MAG: acyloxyacyl hydrolase, partial [Psychroserpens sp.]|nr:acyloxyacyl hydrolase [Psychroserpens sp.]